MDLNTLFIGLAVLLLVALPFFIAVLVANPYQASEDALYQPSEDPLYTEDPLTQDFENIGKPSDELEAVAAEKQGRQGSPAKPQVDEVVSDFDFSRYDRRSNLQALGLQGGLPGAELQVAMAGYSEGSMAGHTATPWATERSAE